MLQCQNNGKCEFHPPCIEQNFYFVQLLVGCHGRMCAPSRHNQSAGCHAILLDTGKKEKKKKEKTILFKKTSAPRPDTSTS